MKFIFLAIFALFTIIALVLQWRDCIKGYGNTTGAMGFYNSLWILASIFLSIYFSSYIKLSLSIIGGITFFIFHYVIVYMIEKIGTKYK